MTVIERTTRWLCPEHPAVAVEMRDRCLECHGPLVERDYVVVPAEQLQGAVKALDEIVRVIDGIERGEPFGDEEVGTMDPLTYVGDVARSARGQ